MKWIKRLVAMVLVLFLILNVMVIFHAWQFTHFYPDAPKIDLKNLSAGQKLKMLFFGYQFPKSVVSKTPDVPFEEVTLRVEDLNISAWFIPADSVAKVAVLFHGHGSQKGTLLEEAAFLHRQGYACLLVDFRAHGESEGTTCTVGFNETGEVKAAYDWVKAKGFQTVLLYGSSMGAAAIIKSVKEFELEVDRLILEMPFGSLPDAVQGRMRIMGLPGSPLGELLTFWGGVEHGYWAFDYSPCNYSKSLQMPVLLQWGSQDVRVQQHETQCIYDNLAGAKKLVVYEGAGHQSLYNFAPEKWEAEVSKFIGE